MIKNISNNFGLLLGHFRVVLYIVNPTPDVIKTKVNEIKNYTGPLISAGLKISFTGPSD
jgi:hypothetical protein